MPTDHTKFLLDGFPLADRIVVDPSTGCWEWSKARTSAGYGEVWLNGQVTYTHRVSAEFFLGVIPARMKIDHLCRNPPCCNPAHLEVVSHAENLRRGKGAKLTMDDAVMIRLLRKQGVTPKELAIQFGVSRENIYTVLQGRSWTDQ